MNQPELDYFGPYRVEGILGRGGMGTVYKGSHARSGDKVAIKVIATAVADQSRFRRRFAAEIDTLKRLKHPHIVELLGYGEEKGLLFYSMEYVAGHSLLEHMRQHKTLPWEDVIQIGIETAAALKHAHDLGIIHRDLKPANLMVSDQGQVKLTDFGIAKFFGSTDMTAAGSVIGTADYMPPEQAEGKTITTRSDLYSLGCVMYALLAGRAPFGGKSVPEVLYAVRYNPVPDLMALAPTCPPELAELIKEMLEKDPLKRPPTALVVGNRLKAIQAGMRKIGGTTKLTNEGIKPLEKIGKELTSLDLSDEEDDEIRLTHPEIGATNEEPTVLAPQKSAKAPTSESFITDGDATSVIASSQLPAIVTERSDKAANTKAAAKVPPAQVPISRSSSSVGDPITSNGMNTGPSRFTHVSDDDARTGIFGTEPEAEVHRNDWIQYVSIGVMVVGLIACVVFAWWKFRPSSANQLYDQISIKVDANDEESLELARPMIDEFLERFPNDSRSADLQAMADDDDLSDAYRQLKRKVAKGRDDASALEYAFLDCLEARQRDFDEYQRKLKAFLVIYGNLAELQGTAKRYVELAEYADKVQPAPKVEITPAAIELEKLIRSAESDLNGRELVNFYESLLLLYDGKDWAAEQMSRIRSRTKTDAVNGKDQ